MRWLAVLVALLLCACEEEAPVVTKPSPSPEVLVVNIQKPTDPDSFLNTLMGNSARTWQVVKRLEGPIDMSMDCYLDDQIIFRRNRRIELLTGRERCRTEGAALSDRKGGWQLTTELNLVIMLSDGLPYQLKVQKLSARSLQLAYISDAGKQVTEDYMLVDTGPETPAASGSPATSERPGPLPSPSGSRKMGLFPF
jgi:hypothetical protein